MANVNAPTGMSPVKSIVAATYNGATNTYYIPSSDTNAYYIGDLVKSYAGADTNGIPRVQPAAAGNTCRGVIVGVYVTGPNAPASLLGAALALENTYIPATKTKDYYVMVCDDPNAIFEIQADAVTAANLVAANMNKNANFIVAAPSSPYQQSATVLDSNSIATTQALPLRIMGLSPLAINNAFGIYCRLLVKFNQHELMGNTAGV